MSQRLPGIEEIERAQLCSGCGACSYMAPEVFRMEDVPDKGRRPRLISPAATQESACRARDAAAVCPGAGLAHDYDGDDPDLRGGMSAGWGPIVGLWEGHAADPELRFSGSSGGAASALALFALEQVDYAGVLHTAARDDAPYLNQTVVSRNRTELLGRTGSRYAPASPCDGLGRIEAAPGPFVFIGKPCDVAAAQAASRLRPALRANLGLTIAFFCAGTPSTEGTLAMLAAMGIEDPERVTGLRYRGNGWPGRATAWFRDETGKECSSSLSYEETWGDILSKHVQWRCRLCVDHTGEFADIAVGDPWYRELRPGEAGSSIIVARTARGRRFLERAIAAGYLDAQVIPDGILVASQPNLLRSRGAVWGRLLGSRLVGARIPQYIRLPTFRFWLKKLSLTEKVASVLGTVRRCFQRGLAGFRN